MFFFQLISLNYLIYLAGFSTITFLYISAYFVASNWIYLCWLSVPVIRIISLQKFYTTDTDFFYWVFDNLFFFLFIWKTLPYLWIYLQVWECSIWHVWKLRVVNVFLLVATDQLAILKNTLNIIIEKPKWTYFTAMINVFSCAFSVFNLYGTE